MSSKFNGTFILTGCREYLHSSVCVWYDASFTQIKRSNAHESDSQSGSGDVVHHVCLHLVRRQTLKSPSVTRFSLCVVGGGGGGDMTKISYHDMTNFISR